MITLEIKNWPEHSGLLIKSSESVATGTAQAADASGNTRGWFLSSKIALAMGAPVEKITSEPEISVVLEFARTVKRLEGMTISAAMRSQPPSILMPELAKVL